MVRSRQVPPDAVRSVDYQPTTTAAAEVEIRTLSHIRFTAGPQEFIGPQRPSFDLLIKIESGSTTHTVDFTEFSLNPGDVVWVRTDQVQQWGDLYQIEGPVVLFTSHALDLRSHEFLRGSGQEMRNHWPGIATPDSLVGKAFDLLVQTHYDTRSWRPAVRAEIISRSLELLVVQLVSATSLGGNPRETPSDAFRWFRDEVEVHFRTDRTVRQYAARVGYAARTLDRVTMAATGFTAKQFIDRRVTLEAKRLLAHSTDPVVQIAADLGFADAANFSKYFQQRSGMTPALFRESFVRAD